MGRCRRPSLASARASSGTSSSRTSWYAGVDVGRPANPAAMPGCADRHPCDRFARSRQVYRGSVRPNFLAGEASRRGRFL